MLDGVKALFRFTMAILYLAFQVTPPSSCEVFATIRNTARDLYDIKLLLSIVDQIKLPKDSYFAIRRSFYMVQSSFNSDQFYMQSLSSDASRCLVANKPLSVQQAPDTKPPALSLISAASLVVSHPFGVAGSLNGGPSQASNGISGSNFTIRNSICTDQIHSNGPRIRTSADRSKICVQSIGKLGRSHLKIIDSNLKSNERSLMSPLRNCIVLGISNCGKNLIVARQSSRRNFKCFYEQDLNFHIHEISTEIFDGFYLEHSNLALVLTHQGELLKIDTSRCFADSHEASSESLMLRDSRSIGENEKVKLRLASMDRLTNLLWIYIECEDLVDPSMSSGSQKRLVVERRLKQGLEPPPSDLESIKFGHSRPRFRHNNPFACDTTDESGYEMGQQQHLQRLNHRRKIIMVDIVTFDIFSAFTIHSSFGELINLRTSLVAFCQLSNPMSSHFSSRIVQIGPTGRYEQLLSFSDVVDYMVTVPDSFRRKREGLLAREQVAGREAANSQKHSSLKRLLIHSKSFSAGAEPAEQQVPDESAAASGSSTLTRYYRSLMRSQSTAVDDERRSADGQEGPIEQQDSANNSRYMP